jgi:hypothetical protein
MRASTLEKYSKLLGAKFGRLTVVGVVEEGKARLQCQCECGNMSTPTYEKLTSGETTSCGCFRKEKMRKAFFARRGNKKTSEMTIWDWK